MDNRMLYTDPIYPDYDEFHPEERDLTFNGLLPGDTVTDGRDKGVVLTLGRWRGKPAVEVELEKNGEAMWLPVDNVKLVDE